MFRNVSKVAVAAIAIVALSSAAAHAELVEYTVDDTLPAGNVSFAGVAGAYDASANVTFGTFTFEAGDLPSDAPFSPVPFELTVTQTAPTSDNGPLGGSGTISGFIQLDTLGLMSVTFNQQSLFLNGDANGVDGPVEYRLNLSPLTGTPVFTNAPDFTLPFDIAITGSVIFDAAAQVVPVPPAVFAGLSLLGGLGLVKGRSKIASLLR